MKILKMVQRNTLIAVRRQSARRLECSSSGTLQWELFCEWYCSPLLDFCRQFSPLLDFCSQLSPLLNSSWLGSLYWYPFSTSLEFTLPLWVREIFCFPESKSHFEGWKSSSSNAYGSWLSSKSSLLASFLQLGFSTRPNMVLDPLLS